MAQPSLASLAASLSLSGPRRRWPPLLPVTPRGPPRPPPAGRLRRPGHPARATRARTVTPPRARARARPQPTAHTKQAPVPAKRQLPLRWHRRLFGVGGWLRARACARARRRHGTCTRGPGRVARPPEPPGRRRPRRPARGHWQERRPTAARATQAQAGSQTCQ